MKDLIPNLIVIASTAIIVALIFFLTHRAKKQKIAHLQSFAVKRGLRFEQIKERLASGYRLIGDNWMLESILIAKGPDVEPHLSNMSKNTTFTSEAIFLPRRNLFIGPAEPHVELGEFGEMMKKKMIEKYLGPSGVGMHEVQAGSSTFFQQFKIMANSEEDARRIFSPRCEPLLMRWHKNKPVVKVTQSGLEIRIEDAFLEKEEDIQALIDLGKIFISSL